MAPTIHNYQHILIYGVGGVGGYFGGLLANALNKGPVGGRQVHFIARGEHLAAIQENGLLLKTSDGQELRCIPNTASDDPTPLPTMDLILLCTKGADLEGALETIKEKVTPSTVIIPLLNGMDVVDRIRAVLDKGLVLPSCVYISSRISAPGEITQVGDTAKIITGNAWGTRDVYPESLLMLALQAKWHIDWVEKPQLEIWKKYYFIAPFALVTASYELTMVDVLENENALADLKGMMDEVAAVASAEGYLLDEGLMETHLELAKSFPRETKTSFQQDVEAGKGKTEKDSFGSSLIQLGKKHNIAMAVTEKLLKTLEKVPGGR